MVVTSDIEDKNHYNEEGRERGMGSRIMTKHMWQDVKTGEPKQSVF